MASSLRKLRPAKVRNALRRRRFEYQVPRMQFSDAPGLIDLGTSYGGWTVPVELIEPSWVCYCVGAGGDISFDLELIRRYGVEVRTFDPVADYVESAQQQGAAEPRFAAGLYESEDFIEVPGRTLPSLMAELGDERIDLLKLDIEGAEYEVLPTIDMRALGVKVFAAQLHHTGSVGEARALIAGLDEQGYEPVACRSAVKVTFALRDLL